METARPLNITIIASGVWLILSAFLWRHGVPQLWNAIGVGAASVALGLLALRRSPRWVIARYLVVPLGTWLLVSTWLFRSGTVLTVANHLVLASVLLGVAMLPVLGEEPKAEDSLPT